MQRASRDVVLYPLNTISWGIYNHLEFIQYRKGGKQIWYTEPSGHTEVIEQVKIPKIVIWYK